MNLPIVHDNEPVLLVGGGKHRKHAMSLARPLTGKVVAADSGADWLINHDILPDMVFGDFDSISPSVKAKISPDRAHKINEQDSTDFAKCLTRIDAPLVLGVGFTGGRSDHQLAAYHALMRYPERRCALIGPRDFAFLAPPELKLDLPRGTRVSLFPFASVRARSTGLRWPVDAVRFDPLSKIGTSNEAEGSLTLKTDGPSLLVILPVPILRLAVRALLEPCAQWPARKEP